MDYDIYNSRNYDNLLDHGEVKPEVKHDLQQ